MVCCWFGDGSLKDDRPDLPIDVWFVALLFEASEDPEVSLGNFASGVPVGPGARLPRLPAYAPKRKWLLPKGKFLNPGRTLQQSNRCYGRPNAQRASDCTYGGRSPRKSHQPYERLFPGRIVRTSQVVSFLPVFYSMGPTALLSTRGQESETKSEGPVAADLKRSMREKATGGICTFALTADVSEAHQQIPSAKCAWHLLGCT